MEDELLKKAKKRRIRTVAILVIVALAATSAVFGMSLKSAKAEKAKAAAAQEQTTDAAAAADSGTAKKSAKTSQARKDKAAARKVDELIAAIGDPDKVTLDSKDTIQKAKKAYDKLSKDQKEIVENKEVLTAALNNYRKLVKEKKAEAAKKNGSSSSASTASAGKSVTISIECKDLAKDMSKLKDPAKKKYVPSSGVILSSTKYEFKKGETVYDALKYVCRTHGIAYIKKEVGAYDGVYISSIGHLAEFDGGKNSGWLYYVNGVTPNYTCSKYKLKNGDVIRWHYTVNYTKE